MEAGSRRCRPARSPSATTGDRVTLDEFVLKFVIDPSGVKQGATETLAATSKLSQGMTAAVEEGEKAQTGALATIVQGWNSMVAAQRKGAEAGAQAGKAMVATTESVAASGEKALRTFGALFLLFAGARSIKDFTSGMISLDAAIGRIAHNTGSTTEVISGIGRAAERVGGDFNGAIGGVKAFIDSYQQLKLTGQSGILDPIARLQGITGKQITLTDDWRRSLGDVADALQVLDKRDPAQADYLGRQIAGDGSLANLLKRGRAGLDAATAGVPKISKQQSEDAQKLQASIAAVHQEFQQLGNSILMDFGPAAIQALRWFKDLVSANRDLIETKVKEWVGEVGQWFDTHKEDIKAFGSAIGDLVKAIGTVATAFASQSPAMQALEAFAVLMGGAVLRAVTGLSTALGALFALPAPAWFLALAGGSAAAQWQGAKDTAQTLGSDDPTKNDVVVDPESGMATKVAPGEGNQGTGPNTGFSKNGLGGVLSWLKGKLGLGGQDDPKTRDAISDTAKATGEMRDLMKAQKEGLGQGSTVNVGGSANLGSGAPNLRYGRRDSGSSGAFRGTPVPDAPYNGKNIDGLTEAQSKQYAAILGNRESGNRYGTTNPYGYVGRWQFGASALAENGYVKRGTTNAGLSDPNNWTGKGGVHSVEEWKANKGGVQDQALGEYTNRHYAQLRAAGVIRDGMSPADVAGWLAAAHLKGVGGAIALSRGRDNVDANGTSASSYRRMMEGVGKGAVVSAAAMPAPTAQAPVPAGTSAAAVGDAAAFAAEQRLKAGGSDPKDRALLDRYRAQQNAPKAERPAAARAPAQPTVGHAVHRVLHAIAQANRLTHHNDNHPVPVTDAGAMKLQERTFGAFAKWGARHPDQLEHAKALAHGRAASLDRMTRLATSGGHYSHSVSSTSSTTIHGGVNVHTAATDARGIAADIEPHLRRGQAAVKGDYGWA